MSGRITFDDVSFIVDIRCTGDVLHLPAKRQRSEESMLEEQPMARGSSGFLPGVHPDQVQYRITGDECHIRLGFDL